MLFLLAQSTVSETTRVEERLEFANLPENWAAVLMMALVIVGCWWIFRTYRREARSGSTPTGRMVLATIRCTVMLLLAGIWLQPVLAPYFHRHIEANTLVLVDRSLSMGIQDRGTASGDVARVSGFLEWANPEWPDERPPARHELTAMLLNYDDSAFLKGLAARNQVQVVSFADVSEPLAAFNALREDAGRSSAIDWTIDIASDGPQTDVGQALRQSIEGLGGGPVSGVIVISDGGFNAGESVEVLGEFARALDVPVHTIGIGAETPPPNIRVSEISGPSDAFVEDPFKIVAHVEVEGLDNSSVTVELRERRVGAGSDSGRVISSKRVVVGAQGTQVDFEHRRQTAGRFIYEVAIPADAREAIVQDNDGRWAVNVLDNKMRVLVVSGGPSWTYRFMTRLLERDATIDVSCWLQSADRTAVRDGNTIIDHLPDVAAELFEYDALIFVDPDPALLPPGWAELVDEHATRNGAGVIYCSGRKQTPQFFRDARVKPVVDLLPVTPDPEADLILNQLGYYQKSSSPIEVTQEGLGHSALAMQSSGDMPMGHDPWTKIANVFWHYPVRHEKPAASVLLRHGHPRMRNAYGGHVLLATQFVGSGRSAFLAFDGTWRWRRYGEEVFNRFWVQLIRFVAEGRLLGGSARGRIQTDADRYRTGQTVAISARLSDERFQPLERQEVNVALEAPDGQRSEVVLTRDTLRPGWYKGRFVPRQAGEYTLGVTLPQSDGTAETISHQVAVREPDVEYRRPELDRARLARLSEASAGGDYYDIDQARTVPEAIPDRHETRTQRGSPTPLWDTSWMLGVLLVLLGVEWALRKRWQLL